MTCWLAATLSILLVLFLLSCANKIDYAKGASLTGGDPAAGKDKIILHDCHSCHVIPGIPENANSRGPTLRHWGGRSTIARTWPNTAENLEDFLEHPDRMLHATGMKSEMAMPTIKPADAKDIAAYLFSIE